jgi:hypothetical protein
MNISDKNRISASFIFHRREEEKRHLLLAWRIVSTGPYLCLPGRKRRGNFSSYPGLPDSTLCRNAASGSCAEKRSGRESVVLTSAFIAL